MAGASLPNLPRGAEFEELVASAFQCAGWFVERDLTERDSVPILQLDAIATNYDTKPIALHLVEAKSGDWGFNDIFRTLGYSVYLDIPEASLVALPEREKFEKYRAIAKRAGVNLVRVEDLTSVRANLEGLTGRQVGDDVDLSTWRFAYWAERRLLRIARAGKKRTGESAERYLKLVSHWDKINSGIFFTKTIADRVRELYSTYSDHKNLAGRCAQEMDQGSFGDENSLIPADLFHKVFHQCEVNEIQTACWLEHRARLSLLKSAVDYLCYKADGAISKAEKVISIDIKGKRYKVPLRSFPLTFDAALEELAGEAGFRRYAILWQWFLGVFGGFILLDYEKQDYELLARASGLAVDEVPLALDAYGKLFPLDSGWFVDSQYASIRHLKLFPPALMGVGANYRRLRYSKTGEFRDLALSGLHTLDDLIRWNNSTVELLTK